MSEPKSKNEKTNVEPQTTTPAEEWGERIDTSRQIARGGSAEGTVAGAEGDDVHDPRSGGGHGTAPDVGVPDGMPKNP